MKVSKMTLGFAKRRGFEIKIEGIYLKIYGADTPFALYRAEMDGSLRWVEKRVWDIEVFAHITPGVAPLFIYSDDELRHLIRVFEAYDCNARRKTPHHTP